MTSQEGNTSPLLGGTLQKASNDNYGHDVKKLAPHALLMRL
jgi:hypothetical protein